MASLSVSTPENPILHSAELEALRKRLSEIPSEQLPRLLGDLEVIRAMAWQRTAAPSPIQAPDQLLDAAAAAERLGVSKDYVYDHAEQFPFMQRMGRKMLFSARGIDRYIVGNGRLTARQQRRKIGLVR
jgi:hypothetical protein